MEATGRVQLMAAIERDAAGHVYLAAGKAIRDGVKQGGPAATRTTNDTSSRQTGHVRRHAVQDGINRWLRKTQERRLLGQHCSCDMTEGRRECFTRRQHG